VALEGRACLGVALDAGLAGERGADVDVVLEDGQAGLAFCGSICARAAFSASAVSMTTTVTEPRSFSVA
jgi:hypothetical protein